VGARGGRGAKTASASAWEEESKADLGLSLWWATWQRGLTVAASLGARYEVARTNQDSAWWVGDSWDIAAADSAVGPAERRSAA
jgi:hypothetical protein